MKKLDEIKARRQQRFFERRMAKAKAKKRTDVENELMKHSDLINDPKVKAYIQRKKEAKRQKDLETFQKSRGGAMGKDVEMLESESEVESIEEVKVAQKVKPKKGGATLGAKTKVIKKK
jgi:hypothetical protein